MHVFDCSESTDCFQCTHQTRGQGRVERNTVCMHLPRVIPAKEYSFQFVSRTDSLHCEAVYCEVLSASQET